MGLIKKPNLEKDKVSVSEQFREQTILTLTQNFNNTANTHFRVFQSIWKNPDGLSWQECFDALGADAVTLVKVANLSIQIMALIDPGSEKKIPPPPASFKLNEDGTVTVEVKE